MLGDVWVGARNQNSKVAVLRARGPDFRTVKYKGIAFVYRLGRKIIYRGADLNAWAEANRVEPARGDQ